MSTCTRTAVDVALTGVGVCTCAHKALDHSSDGCGRCAGRIDRPRVYRGEQARHWRRLSPERQQGR